MRTLGLLCGISALFVSTAALAQDHSPTVRVENGFAVSVGEPQQDRFLPGFAGMAKVGFDLVPWLDVGPSIGLVALAPNDGVVPGSGIGGAWLFGVGGRIKRSHTASGGLWGNSSPWIDGDWQYIRTGELNRMGADVGAGISMPWDAERHWWLGAYMRYDQVTDGTSLGGTASTPGHIFDTRDERVVSMGLQVEFDPYKYVKPAPAVVYEPVPMVDKLPTPKVATVKPEMVRKDMTEVVMTADATIQFDFDSAVISASDKTTLDAVATTINTHLTAVANDLHEKKIKSVQVDGHASSENHPWAEKHNQMLSEKRAQAVVDYLISKGVPSAMLSVKGFGTSMPVATNATEAGRKLNRRVEFEVTVSLVR